MNLTKGKVTTQQILDTLDQIKRGELGEDKLKVYFSLAIATVFPPLRGDTAGYFLESAADLDPSMPDGVAALIINDIKDPSLRAKAIQTSEVQT